MGRRTLRMLVVATGLALVAGALPVASLGPSSGPPSQDGGGSDIIDVGCTATIPVGAASGQCETTFSRDVEPGKSAVILVHALVAAEATVDVSWYSGGNLYYRLHCVRVAGTSTPFFHRHVALRTPAPDEHPDGSPLEDVPTTCSVREPNPWSSVEQRIVVDAQLPLHQTCVHPFKDCGFHGGFSLD